MQMQYSNPVSNAKIRDIPPNPVGPVRAGKTAKLAERLGDQSVIIEMNVTSSTTQTDPGTPATPSTIQTDPGTLATPSIQTDPGTLATPSTIQTDPGKPFAYYNRPVGLSFGNSPGALGRIQLVEW